MRPTARDRLIDLALLIGAASQLVPGVWAFVATAGFAGTVAQFDPYNQHYLRDVGAFQIGLGVAACVALRWRDGVVVAAGRPLATALVHRGHDMRVLSTRGNTAGPPRT